MEKKKIFHTSFLAFSHQIESSQGRGGTSDGSRVPLQVGPHSRPMPRPHPLPLPPEGLAALPGPSRNWPAGLRPRGPENMWLIRADYRSLPWAGEP